MLKSIISKALTLVESIFTLGAHPATSASSHRAAHKHQLSPAFKPLNENSFDVLPTYEGEDILEFDTFGETIMHGVVYNLSDNGFSQVVCYDWSKEISKIQGRIDELTIGISNKEYGEWLNSNSN